MALTQKSVVHTGTERWEAVLVYDEDELKRIERMTPLGEIITDTVVLVWTRTVGEGWKRYTRGQYGSRAIGHVKLEHPHNSGAGVRRSHEIFTSDLGEIKRWAEYLPGLRTAIDEAEAGLPTPNLIRAQTGLTR